MLLLTAVLHLSTIRSGHDWGGDFAHYLRHAENIVDGRAYGETGYVRTPLMSYVSTSSYPPGFPLLLAPVRLVAGRSMLPFKVEGVLFLVGALALLRVWARGKIGDGAAFLLLFLFGWSAAVIEESDRILSDVPFLFFLLLSLIVIERAWRRGRIDPGGAALVAALVLFTTLIRPVGALLLVPFLGEGLRRGGLRSVAPWAAAAAIAAGVVVFRVLMPDLAYGGLFAGASPGTVWKNLRYYRLLTERFLPPFPLLPGARYPLFLILSTFALAGMVRSIRRGLWPLFLFVLAQVAVLIVFPFQQGHRYLFPVYPFLLYWMLLGAGWIGGLFSGGGRRVAAAAGAAFLVLWTGYGVASSGLTTRGRPDGPESPAAAAFLDYVENLSPEEALFSFWKPRVLAYYTGRSAVALPILDELEEMAAWFRKWGVTHVAFDRKRRWGRVLLEDVAADKRRFRPLYDDGRFLVFEIRRSGPGGEGEAGSRKTPPAAAREKGGKDRSGSDTLRRNRAPEEDP
ncbi:MAG: hypothetical protein JW958_05445 [Candidatus Eisenbacteria bacterium]|nr:hypothetical protein [Candidatus Eisenbacteria bacterium]